MEHNELFAFWRSQCPAPFCFPMKEATWADSMFSDVDSEGNRLFSELRTEVSGDGRLTGLIQYGYTAFGFATSGEISAEIHYPVIRCLYFDPRQTQDGQQLLSKAMSYFGVQERVYAFFHYFGMSACGRHGKLHESSPHVAQLLLQNGFAVEHENVYYARTLDGTDNADDRISLCWKERNPGNCREFAARMDGTKVCWGQIHFLPQGDTAYLRWIYVDDKKQHQGVGSAVMQTLFAELSQMGILRFDTDTALDNLAAQRYYEKTGFSNEGITRSYFTR